MRFDHPDLGQIPALRRLWRQAFGDEERFLDMFFSTGFAPDRCRCVWEGEALVAAAYWLDGALEERTLAYVYAVATDKDHRGRGIGSALMEDLHRTLTARGYAGAALVPGAPGLRRFYQRLGYRDATKIAQIRAKRCLAPVDLVSLDPAAFARRRSALLPDGALIQEGPALDFLAAQARFYEGPGFLLAAQRRGGELFGLELLGDLAQAPGILAALGEEEGTFRCPGGQIPFAMYHAFDGGEGPKYLAFAFD